MASQIQFLKAKRRILDSFPPGVDPVRAAKDISDEELLSLLSAVSSSMPWKKAAQADSLAMFLYAGVTRFDRWFVPTPYVVPPTHREQFSKFVNAFQRAEGREPTNCAVFQLHAIRDEVFGFFDTTPIEIIQASDVRRFCALVERVLAPSNAVKNSEFHKQRAELLTILEGLNNKSLRTQLRFRVPYVLHRQPLKIDFVWRGISIRAQIDPKFSPPEETFVQTASNCAVESVGASRWQTGTSSVSLELSALLDGSAYTEQLQAIANTDFPAKGWPQSFTWAFSIFHDLAWTLRARNDARQDWIPAPRDLSDLEQVVSTSGMSNLGWIRKGSPAASLEIFVPSSDPVTINLGEIQRLPWSMECRIRANMYLELGDTNEALFWINVATESLIAQRLEEIEIATGRVGLAINLGSPKEFWAEAELILAKQFPEMQGKVSWPSSSIHVSVYGKLKALYRLVPMKTSLEELLSKYRDISGQRNELFHGKSSARATVCAVQTASEAISWIDKNLWAAEA